MPIKKANIGLFNIKAVLNKASLTFKKIPQKTEFPEVSQHKTHHFSF